jgi:fatty acid desaturase
MSKPERTAADKGPCLLKIGDKWVNVETWKKTHPGLPSSIERMKNVDVTDPFLSIHSKEARNMVTRMKSVSPPAGYVKEADPSLPNKTSLSFRQFREELERDGWFERSVAWETFYIGTLLGLCLVGTLICRSHPWLAIALIGLGSQQGGWSAHDWLHARGKFAYWFGRVIGGGVVGLSAQWWSEKHNTHHVHTNQLGIDDDIANDPVLHLWVPTPQNDFWFRKYQHFYYHFAYAMLYVSWRIQSLQYAWARRAGRVYQLELAILAVNYLWLLYLGPFVAIGSILFGGWLVAEVVTATHQSEDMIDGMSFQFAEDQFRTTRDVIMHSGFFNWFWGGMQWQLEHHLFPFMPKYRYAQVNPLVRKWAKENGIEYRSSGAMEILQLNYETMKRYAVTTWKEFQAECAANTKKHT